MIGQSIGRYHILEKLGEGGMATVYRAFDTRLERDVALKVIQPIRQQSPEFLKRFEREAKALAQLAHPNIVSIHDFGEQDGMPYLVMEYTPGGTLKQSLGEPMPWPQACRLLAPIARALHYAHQQKIIHRDIKPSNILITASGDPKLSDFGIAKILEAEKTWDLTGTGVGIGTPEYMAPEQGMGKAIDHRADIYALGIVLFEMVTGRTPFRADTPLAVLLKQVNDPLPRPREFVEDLPKAVEQVLFKALAKNPEDRFQEMGDFAGAIEVLLRNEEKAGGESRTLLGGRLRRIGVIGGAAAILILGAAGLLWAVGAFPQLGDRSSSGSSSVRNDGLPAEAPQRAILPAAEGAAAIQDSGPPLYDDFEVSGPVMVMNPLRWLSETNFQVKDGVATLEAAKGQSWSYKANLESTNHWTPSGSGAMRFSVEARIRVDRAVSEYSGDGFSNFQLTGPAMGYGRWTFTLGYVFESGFLAYECAGAFSGWVAEPLASLSQTIGAPKFGEWHVFRVSLEEGAEQGELAYIGYVDNQAVCSWTPPGEWQEAIDEGGSLSFFLGNRWTGPWIPDRPFRAYFDDVKAGTGTDS